MKKIAIIGASYLQEPLIRKAQSMGYETHVFAWECGDIGEKTADFFYPISIVEKEDILIKCREIGIDGICTIASDLAVITVNYVAVHMGLIGNSMECTMQSTNKFLMRACFKKYGDPSPRSIKVTDVSDLDGIELHYPIIIKPTDRSGSRGITKLDNRNGVEEAIAVAMEQGFEKAALVEEFVTGQEYSVEYISWKGEHHFLALTHKYTSGAPHFVESGHMEPAPVTEVTMHRIQSVVSHALDSIGIQYGASHSELKVAKDGTICIIEIGGRMGGDFIGSNLVQLSTGVDYMKAVLDVAMGIEPQVEQTCHRVAGVRFVFNEDDIKVYKRLQREHPEYIILQDVKTITNREVLDSGSRFGYYLLAADKMDQLLPYMPREIE